MGTSQPTPRWRSTVDEHPRSSRSSRRWRQSKVAAGRCIQLGGKASLQQSLRLGRVRSLEIHRRLLANMVAINRRTIYGCSLFLILLIGLHAWRPAMMFDEDGRKRPFGTSATLLNDTTMVPFGVGVVLLAVFSYYTRFSSQTSPRRKQPRKRRNGAASKEKYIYRSDARRSKSTHSSKR